MRAYVVTLAAIIAATPALAAERSFNVGGFNTLSVAGPYDVVFTTGGAPHVRATGEQADLENLKVEVRGGNLEIGPRERGLWRNFRNSQPVKIEVTGPSIREVELAGSGDIVVDRLRGQRATGSVAGSGNLKIGAIESKAAVLSIAGSGDISAAGACSAADYSIAGSGDIRAGNLKCQTLKVSIAGSGGVNAFATSTANVSIMGSGDVNIAGGARCKSSKMGSGDVTCR